MNSAAVTDAGPGDQTARQRTFLELLNAHLGIVHRVSRAYAAGSTADQQDLFQEIVYQLWRSYPTYRGASSPVTWVYRVALNTAITSVRKRARRPAHVPLEDSEPVASTPPGERPEVAQLYRAIQQLSDVERALVMCYLDDLSYSRIAEVLGLSETNVGVRLTRVKAKLQRLVAGSE